MTEERIRTRRIELVDNEGKVRMILGGGQRGEHGPQIDLYDEEGSRRASMSVIPNGGVGLYLLDAQDKPRLGITFGSVSLSEERLPEARRLMEAQMVERYGLDPAEVERMVEWQLVRLGEDTEIATIQFLDQNGKARATLGMLPQGPMLSLVDEGGQSRAGMAVVDTEATVFVINEDQVATLPSEPEEPMAPESESSQRRISALKRMSEYMPRWLDPTIFAHMRIPGENSKPTFEWVPPPLYVWPGERHPGSNEDSEDWWELPKS